MVPTPRHHKISTFEPIRFIPSYSKAETPSLAVTQIWAVAHTVDGAEEDGNHWCFNLLISGGTSSVRIDITPTVTVPSTTLEGGSKANMIVSSHSYPASKNARFISKLQVRKSLRQRRGGHTDRRRGPSIRVHERGHWVQIMGQHPDGVTTEQGNNH